MIRIFGGYGSSLFLFVWLVWFGFGLGTLKYLKLPVT